MGKPGNRTRLEPNLVLDNQRTGGRDDTKDVEALDADGVSYQAYYSGCGKAMHMGKDLTEVRSS